MTGRWGVTTLPLRNPLVYVLGKPLPPPRGWAQARAAQLAAVAAAPGAEGAAPAPAAAGRSAARGPSCAQGGGGGGGRRGGGHGASGAVTVPQVCKGRGGAGRGGSVPRAGPHAVQAGFQADGEWPGSGPCLFSRGNASCIRLRMGLRGQAFVEGL
jgi:hypothetical protein